MNLGNLRILLAAQLKTYGLDPREWLVSKISREARTLILEHREDPDFQILGRIEERPGRLSFELSLLSI